MFKELDLSQTLAGIVALISIITAVYKVGSYFYNKLMTAVIENRRQNEQLTNEIKKELIDHTRDDNRKFESIGNKFEKLIDMSTRTDENVKMLINNHKQ